MLIAFICSIYQLPKQRLLIEKLLKIFNPAILGTMLQKNTTNGESRICEVTTLWDKWGWGNQRHMKHEVHDKLMMINTVTLMWVLYWNKVGFPGWKLSGWSNNGRGYIGDLVKKEVGFDCLAFLYMSLHNSSYGSMTAFISCLNFRHLSMNWSFLPSNQPRLLHNSTRIFIVWFAASCHLSKVILS